MASQATLLFAQRAYEEGVPIGAIFVLCRNRGLLPAAAAELAEEAAAEAHRRALVHDDFQSDAHYRNWVARTGRNWASDELRRRRKVRPFADGAEHWVSGTEEMDDLAEELPRLHEYMARLPEDDREVLRLTFVERLTLDEIAERIEPGGPGSANARRLRMMRKRDVAIERLRGYFNA